MGMAKYPEDNIKLQEQREIYFNTAPTVQGVRAPVRKFSPAGAAAPREKKKLDYMHGGKAVFCRRCRQEFIIPQRKLEYYRFWWFPTPELCPDCSGA